MFTTKTENDLFNDLVKGDALDVLCHIPARYYEEELAEILWIWSQHRNNPTAFLSAMNNKIAALIVEAANNIEELDEVQSEEDRRRAMLDENQEYLRDRRAQEGF